jgi:hypothetical protein
MDFEISVCIAAFLRIFVKNQTNGNPYKNTLWPSLGRFGTPYWRNNQRNYRQIENLRKEGQDAESFCYGVLAHPVADWIGIVFYQ